MNLWHDISPERMQPEDFLVVIELKRAQKTNMSWTSRPVRCGWTGSSTPRRTTRPITALSRAPMPMTEIRWTCWFCAASQFARCAWCGSIRSDILPCATTVRWTSKFSRSRLAIRCSTDILPCPICRHISPMRSAIFSASTSIWSRIPTRKSTVSMAVLRPSR